MTNEPGLVGGPSAQAAQRTVFLSYASEDADAAQRICAALRAAGIEVWFDQSELRGGGSARPRPPGGALIADETRRTGGISEGVITTLVDPCFTGRIARVASQDSFIPLGDAGVRRCCYQN